MPIQSTRMGWNTCCGLVGSFPRRLPQRNPRAAFSILPPCIQCALLGSHDCLIPFGISFVSVVCAMIMSCLRRCCVAKCSAQKVEVFLLREGSREAEAAEDRSARAFPTRGGRHLGLVITKSLEDYKGFLHTFDAFFVGRTMERVCWTILVIKLSDE